MMKQWLLAPHFGFASDDSRQLGTKSSHMDLPDVVWFPFDEAELDDQAVDVEDLDNPILNEEPDQIHCDGFASECGFVSESADALVSE
jgi:hypothetical protein